VEKEYVGGANRSGGSKKGIRGIFAISFSGPNGGGTGAETRLLLCPWKGEAQRPQDRMRGGAAILPGIGNRPMEQESPS